MITFYKVIFSRMCPVAEICFFSCDPTELFCCSVRSVTVLSHQFTTELSVVEDLAQGYIISWLCQETATKIKL